MSNIKCPFCGNDDHETLKIQGESNLIKGANYVICSCGNVMILKDGVVVPTPTERNKVTELLIQDAIKSLHNPSGLTTVSYDGKELSIDEQPSQVKENLLNYIDNYIQSVKKCEEDLETADYDSDDYFSDYDDDYSEFDYDYEEEEDEEEYECCNNVNENNKSYLLIMPSGDKQIYRHIGKEFMEGILNDIGSHFHIYELKEVKLNKEEVKTVKYTL